MGVVSATGAERLSLGLKPVTKTGAALFLSEDRAAKATNGKAQSRKPAFLLLRISGGSDPAHTLTLVGQRSS
jgi:hypothetical protein